MSDFLKLMENWDGFVSLRSGKASPAVLARMVDLISGKGMSPHRQRYLLSEAVSTSDFPYLLGQVLDRQVLASYKAVLPLWKAYTKVSSVADFRDVYRHKIQGTLDTELDLVPQQTEYPEAMISEARYSYHVDKYGRRFGIGWEALVNDAMGAFSDVVSKFSLAAVRTEAIYVTRLFADSSGPNTNLFGAPISDVDGQDVTNLGALALDITNLGVTLKLMAQQTDLNGHPISVRGVHLVVPPALEITARQILTSALVAYTESAGGALTTLPTANVLPQMGLTLHVDPLLPVVDTTSADTTWYVFAEPSQGAAMEVAYLRGHETPEICMRAPNKVSPGGGSLSPLSGSFDSDEMEYRVRIVFGGKAMDPRFAYAQVG